MAATMIRAIKSPNVFDEQRPGAFEFTDEHSGSPERTFMYICPCGCGRLRSIPVNKHVKRHLAWEWDGDVESPTLTPWIAIAGECGWTGYLQHGQWIKA